MRIYTIITVLTILSSKCVAAVVPMQDFKSNHVIDITDKIVKWECDLNADGKNEVFLALKSNYKEDTENNDTPNWNTYIAEDGGFIKPEGVETGPDSMSVGEMPAINPAALFVGFINEIGKQGLITLTLVSGRNGSTTAKVFAYTIEGDHLKRTQLAEYDSDNETVSVSFAKYFDDDKRTHVTLQEVAP
jgi:hypothetical protein